MLHLKVRARTLSALVCIGITCGGLVAVAGSARAAAVSCPTVSGTGEVTPTPTPGVNWSGCSLAGASLAAADLASANLAGADLAGADLTAADLQQADLAGANLSGADLKTADLEWGASLAGADISGANLTGALLFDVASGGVTASTAAKLPANWRLTGGYLLGPWANLSGADLANLDLTGVDLASAKLTAANISGTNLTGATLTGVASGGLIGTPAHLPTGAYVGDGYLLVPRAFLLGVSLTNLNLPGVDLAQATLDNADLAGSNLAGANLTGTSDAFTNFTGANLAGVTANNANFWKALLTSTNLNQAYLPGVNLTDVTSGGITGTPKLLPAPWKLVNGYLAGPAASLTGASLHGANLAGADLSGASLANADLSSANLSGANLTNGNAANTDSKGTNFSGATLVALDLAHANLADANMTHANLSSANLSGVNMSGTNFAGANLGIVSGAPSAGTPVGLPSNFFLMDGYLFGPGVDLEQVILEGIDLHGHDLRGTSIRYSHLEGANLDGVNLTGASLFADTVTGATFAGVTWGNTTCPNGSNSNKYVDGCFSALDTTPPVVTVTGVGNDKVYVNGAVPKAGCKTTDNGTVATQATLKVTTTGKNGVGRFTATCSGAVDLAGNKQKAPVSVTYTVVYGLHGFIAPANGATIARSSKTITVRLRLTSASGAAISASLASALAAAHDVRVTLQGPAIKAVTVYCGWNASQQDLTCAIGIPSGVRTGTAQSYTLTAAENVGTGFLTVPVVKGGANPEVIHFR